jgi:hypothetical protein
MGINRFVYHTFAHKPLPDKYRPGMTMGPYGVHWDRGQTWWPMAYSYHKYVTRCQYVLSQGKAVSDILYLTPEGAPQVFLPPKSALDGTAVMPDKKGYSFDGCSPLFLIKNAAVRDGMIVFPSGSSYRLLVLPEIETMTPELVTKLEELIRAGATVIGNPPIKSPSLVNYPQCDIQVKSLSEKIWGTGDLPMDLTVRQYGSGRILCGKKLKENIITDSKVKDSLNLYPDYKVAESILKKEGVNPDFRSSDVIRYTHRSLPDRDIYFISNKTDIPVYDTCYFRNGSAIAELWNPVTSEINVLKSYNEKKGLTVVPVKMEPFQSFFIVFYHNHKPKYVQTPATERFPEKQLLFGIAGPWNISFDTAWGGPEHIIFNELTDWSKRPEAGIKYYSGSAIYSISFDLPGNMTISEKTHYFLDLGKLKNLGRIKLNDKDLGVLWTSPWQVNITGLLKDKGNRLDVTVANLWINRLIGDEDEPWDGINDRKWPEWLINGTERPTKRYTFTTHRFYKKDDPLSESGLLGPVTIQTVADDE